jgi:hypothetical protein
MLLPNTTSVSSPFVRDALTNPGAGCVVDTGAILGYFNINKPLWMTVGLGAGGRGGRWGERAVGMATGRGVGEGGQAGGTQ